jgi:proteasome lid subunit RPN8/RPN11
LLSELFRALTDRLHAEPWENFDACRAWSRMLDALLDAQEGMQPVMWSIPSGTGRREKRRVVVTEEKLREWYQSLFPAERMLVVAGRRTGGMTRLTEVFDVTGDQSGGHVRADRDLLGRALITMTEAGSFLAGWVHSHPGLGPAATHPSPTDLDQDRDWLRHYPNVLNAIVVRDRWVRFWGTGVQSRQIEVELLGRGLITENEHGYVYQLADDRRLPDRPAHAGADHRGADGIAVAIEA